MSTTTATEQTAQEIPKVAELGTTSAPLKSAAFFLGAYCKEFNGTYYTAFAPRWVLIGIICGTEDFMLCKAENRDPGHCLKEGRRVTRCATDLCVPHPFLQAIEGQALIFLFLGAVGSQKCGRTAWNSSSRIGGVLS
jgi:hypothetical protein